jgi:hypothetical protein
MNLATNTINTLARRNSQPFGITLDYTNKRVCWIERDQKSVEHIFSSDYDFQHQTNIRNGLFSTYMLAVFGDLMFFQNGDVFSIKEINISNGNIMRSIVVDKAYTRLILMSNSLQPMGM